MAAKMTTEERINALLLKAQTTTPEEAELLTAKAVQLMQKYGIDQALLNAARTGAKERIEKVTIQLNGIYAKAYMDMMYSIANAYGNIRAYYTQWKQSDITFTVIGFESDVSQLKVLLASLQLQVVVALNAWWDAGIAFNNASPMERFKARREFIKSFGVGAASRIRTARNDAVREAQATTPGAEIVLRDRGTAVDEFMQASVGKLKTVKNREKRGGLGASSAGYNAGRNANTGDRQVDAGRRAIER